MGARDVKMKGAITRNGGYGGGLEYQGTWLPMLGFQDQGQSHNLWSIVPLDLPL